MEEPDVIIVGDLKEVEARVLTLLTGTGVTVYFDECVGTTGHVDWPSLSRRSFHLTPFHTLYGGFDSPECKGVEDEPIPLSQRKGGGLVHGPVQKRGKGKYKNFS